MHYFKKFTTRLHIVTVVFSLCGLSAISCQPILIQWNPNKSLFCSFHLECRKVGCASPTVGAGLGHLGQQTAVQKGRVTDPLAHDVWQNLGVGVNSYSGTWQGAEGLKVLLTFLCRTQRRPLCLSVPYPQVTNEVEPNPGISQVLLCYNHLKIYSAS